MTSEPSWLSHARAELGVKETPGPVSTKRILEYRAMADMHLGGDDGQVPWCAIFVGAMLRMAAVAIVGANAMARSWLKWGVAIDAPAPGAVVVFKSASRPAPAGHVGFATGRWTTTHVEILGGNQGDRVSVALFERENVLGYRWPRGMALPTIKPVTIAAKAPTASVRDA